MTDMQGTAAGGAVGADLPQLPDGFVPDFQVTIGTVTLDICPICKVACSSLSAHCAYSHSEIWPPVEPDDGMGGAALAAPA